MLFMIYSRPIDKTVPTWHNNGGYIGFITLPSTSQNSSKTKRQIHSDFKNKFYKLYSVEYAIFT